MNLTKKPAAHASIEHGDFANYSNHLFIFQAEKIIKDYPIALMLRQSIKMVMKMRRMTVYDLNDIEQELHAALWGLDHDNADDALEIERLTNKLDETNLIKSQKIEWRVRLIKELECSAVGAKEREKAAIRKRVAAENAVERMKQNLIYTMEVLGIDKIELEDFNVSISNSNPALEIDESFDLRRLPLSCYKVVPEHYEPNKVEIKKYLKDNDLHIKGLTLIKKTSLRIR